MANKPTDFGSAAAQILVRAVELDSEKKYGEAVACYEQGIRLLLKAVAETPEESKKLYLKKKVEEYLKRAEVVKEAYRKFSERKHKQINIISGDTGFSYENVFQTLIDDDLTAVEVQDAYIIKHHQIKNFLRFCEMIVKNAKKLQKIILYTTESTEQRMQKEAFSELSKSLSIHQITLEINYSVTLHDREIRLNNGWIVKIGRGLDYFKKADCPFSLGYFDLDLRPCLETTIDIFPN